MKLLQKMALSKEKLTIAAEHAWDSFLGSVSLPIMCAILIPHDCVKCSEFKSKYDVFHEVMRKLGALDCLDSLATLAKGRTGYVRPVISKTHQVKCHPIIKRLSFSTDSVSQLSSRSLRLRMAGIRWSKLLSRIHSFRIPSLCTRMDNGV